MPNYVISFNGKPIKTENVNANIKKVDILYNSYTIYDIYLYDIENNIYTLDVELPTGSKPIIVKIGDTNTDITDIGNDTVTYNVEPKPNINIDFIYYNVNKPMTSQKIPLKFMNNKAERNKVEKTIENGSLTEPITMYGVFRNNCSITAPVVVIQRDTPLFEYNYAHFMSRYYFVEDIIYISRDLVEIHLVIDILNTYRDGIYKLDAFVDRNESIYKTSIIDDRRIVSSNVTFEIKDCIEDSGTIDDVFSTSSTVDEINGFFILNGLDLTFYK